MLLYIDEYGVRNKSFILETTVVLFIDIFRCFKLYVLCNGRVMVYLDDHILNVQFLLIFLVKLITYHEGSMLNFLPKNPSF